MKLHAGAGRKLCYVGNKAAAAATATATAEAAEAAAAANINNNKQHLKAVGAKVESNFMPATLRALSLQIKCTLCQHVNR